MKKNFCVNLLTIIMTAVMITTGNLTLAANAAIVENQTSGAAISAETSGAGAGMPNGIVKCYPLSDGRIDTFTSSGQKTGYIDGKNDLCEVNFCRTACGRCWVRYPGKSGYREAYVSASAFLNTGYSRYHGNVSANTAVYTKETLTRKLGTVYRTDDLIVCDVKGTKVQICFPVSGGYKMGWLNASTSTQNQSQTPIGYWDYLTSTNNGTAARAVGWAFIPSNTGKHPTVEFFCGNTKLGSTTCCCSRIDVDNVYHTGKDHGFDCVINTGNLTGNLTITAYVRGDNGKDLCLGSKKIHINSKNNLPPTGHLDHFVATGQDLQCSYKGWTFDPTTPTQTVIYRIYADNELICEKSASAYRPDVAKALGAQYGNYHGFTGTVNLKKYGSQSISVYALDTTTKNQVLIGNQTITIRSNEWQWPVATNRKLTQKFGHYSESMQKTTGRGYHAGIDISDLNRGTPPILAIASGTVKYRGWSKSNGNHIVIQHNNLNGQTVYSFYAHLSNFNGCPSVNGNVTAGQKIGTMGNTGNSTGTHVHLGIFTGSFSSDPIGYTTSPNNNKSTYNGRTFYNPEYVINNKRLP